VTVLVAPGRPDATAWRGARSVAARHLAVAAVVVVLAAVHVRRPATVCLLRATTGVPCPFCGGTTAAVHLGHADLRGAAAASPLALLLLAAWPWVGVVAPPRWWHRRALRWSLIGAVLVSAEVWQLLRFGLVGV
jgi:hypothetical protein